MLKKIETMIKIINTVKRLKENPNDLIDGNSLINEQVDEIINEMSNKLKSLDKKHNAIVTISGNFESLSFNVESENDNSIKVIESLIDNFE
jgi:hypothetical protein